MIGVILDGKQNIHDGNLSKSISIQKWQHCHRNINIINIRFFLIFLFFTIDVVVTVVNQSELVTWSSNGIMGLDMELYRYSTSFIDYRFVFAIVTPH
jgi:hypothetical protein